MRGSSAAVILLNVPVLRLPFGQTQVDVVQRVEGFKAELEFEALAYREIFILEGLHDFAGMLIILFLL
jgi:hypothetical protein